MTTKKYGLILPDKNQQRPLTFQASRNVFGNDSDSDDATSKKPVLYRPNESKLKQAKISQDKALLEDPTVYQYDEVYDDVMEKKEKEKAKTLEDKKPRYIEKLMKSANKRKIENERRIERQIQKEREKEGEEFKDKEVFVTSAYKKKIEEMKLEDEKEKREEYLESIGDVTKQRDLGGFYRHLYEQKLGKDENSDKKEKTISDTSATEITDNTTETDNILLDKSNKRNYRKRKISENKTNLSDGEIGASDEEINRVNLVDIKLAKKSKNNENIDADSDFSQDDSSDDEIETKNNDAIDILPENTAKEETCAETSLNSNKEIDSVARNDESKSEEDKPKIDIWKKRTVGLVYQEALKRYYERKAARGS